MQVKTRPAPVGINWHKSSQKYLIRHKSYWVGTALELQDAIDLLAKYTSALGQKKPSTKSPIASLIKYNNSQKAIAKLLGQELLPQHVVLPPENSFKFESKPAKSPETAKCTENTPEIPPLKTIKPVKVARPLVEVNIDVPKVPKSLKTAQIKPTVMSTTPLYNAPLLSDTPDRCNFCANSYYCAYDYKYKICNSYEEWE